MSPMLLEDPARIALASRVRVAIGRINRRNRQNPGGDGLTSSQLSALVTVEGFGPLRVGDLAARERIAAPTMTRIVSGLEQHGLLDKQPDAKDRRACNVVLTVRGAKLLERLRRRTTSFLATQLSQCTAEQRAALEAALPVLEAIASDDADEH